MRGHSISATVMPVSLSPTAAVILAPFRGVVMLLRTNVEESKKGRNRKDGGGQGQNGSCEAHNSPREDGPNLGRPGTPLTAVSSMTLLPSQPLGLRYIPCTCSIGEVVRPQMGEAMPAVTSIRLSILSPPGAVM
jgi:hypothetical protein